MDYTRIEYNELYHTAAQHRISYIAAIICYDIKQYHLDLKSNIIQQNRTEPDIMYPNSILVIEALKRPV